MGLFEYLAKTFALLFLLASSPLVSQDDTHIVLGSRDDTFTIPIEDYREISIERVIAPDGSEWQHEIHEYRGERWGRRHTCTTRDADGCCYLMTWYWFDESGKTRSSPPAWSSGVVVPVRNYWTTPAEKIDCRQKRRRSLFPGDRDKQ